MPLRCQCMADLHNSVRVQWYAEEGADVSSNRCFGRASRTCEGDILTRGGYIRFFLDIVINERKISLYIKVAGTRMVSIPENIVQVS